MAFLSCKHEAHDTQPEAPPSRAKQQRPEEVPSAHPRSANSVRKPAESLLNLSLFSPAKTGTTGRCYAVDTEMVTVAVLEGAAGAPAGEEQVDARKRGERRAMVSVGIVNDRLETVLYSRVAVPRGCVVTDGAFARVHGGLWASWEEGIPASCVSDLLVRHASNGGLIVGWELHGDLEVIGFEKAAALTREGQRDGLPLDVTDLTTPPSEDDDIPVIGGTVQPRQQTQREQQQQQQSRQTPRHRQQTDDGSSRSSGCLDTATGRSGGSTIFSSNQNQNSSDGEQGGGKPNGRCGKAIEDGNLAPAKHIPLGENDKKCCRRDEGSRHGGFERDDSRRSVVTCCNGGSSVDLEIGSASPPHSGQDKEEGASGASVGDGVEGQRLSSDGSDHGVGRGGKGGSKGASLEEEVEAGIGRGMTVVDVTDLFRTTKGLKCMLSEAHTCCFGGTEMGAHNAATDARMTMELYNLWRRVGEPERPIGVPLWFFVVNFHSFKNPMKRQEMLWKVLRPQRGDRATVGERDSDINTYKLLFRNERERDAYLTLLQMRMATAGLKFSDKREQVPGRQGAKDGYQLSCGQFKMHILEHDR